MKYILIPFKCPLLLEMCNAEWLKCINTQRESEYLIGILLLY